ncbi:MAG: DUF4215 domain-containing protein, partial [Nannocystaceae bacterium]
NADNGACTRTCVLASCGDGVIAPGEICDEGEANTDIPYGGGCSNTCQPIPQCGDGTLDASNEACDDGNASNQDACTNTCEIAACGDGLIEQGVEACDDANDDDSDACLTNCELAVCGDGVVQAGVEECDGQINCNESCTRDRFVFATNDVRQGSIKEMMSPLSGVEVADSICRTRANAAGLKGDSDFLAWLSDDETSPAKRFFHSPGRYVLPDGTVVANSWDDLTDGELQHPIDMTETEDSPEQNNAWTNTNPDGTRASNDSCDNWTSKEIDSKSLIGGTTKVDSEWTNRVLPVSCGHLAHLYCFEQE